MNYLKISWTHHNTSSLNTPAYVPPNIKSIPLYIQLSFNTEKQYYRIFNPHSNFPSCSNNVYYSCSFSIKHHTWHLAFTSPYFLSHLSSEIVFQPLGDGEVSLTTLTVLKRAGQLFYGMSLNWDLSVSSELDFG